MQIINFGYKIPDTQDKDFWDQYNFDITRLASHDHDGINSPLLGAGHLNPTLILIETDDWTGPTDELYAFQIPLPSNVTWPNGSPSPVIIQMFDNGNSVPANFGRVDDNNLQIFSRTTSNLVVGLY